MFIKKSLLITIFFFLPFQTFAQTRLSVQGSGQLYPIAIPELCNISGSRSDAQEVSRVIARDLSMSGYFDVLNPESYIETPGKCTSVKNFAYSDWSIIGVEGLVKGEIETQGNNIKIKLYLYDVQIQKLKLAKEYNGELSHLRDIAHKFSNEILKYFTGEFGPFGTKIAFSQRIGRFKELFVIDLDGANLRQLTNDRGLALSAAWSPDAKNILFSNFRKRQPDLFSIRLRDKKYSRVTNSMIQEVGAKYSKNGNNILTAKSQGQKSDLILLDRSGREVKKLTSNYAAIDVSPDWSPDNSRIVFCSNRSGNPQIYTMDANGSNVRRISYVASKYCTSPAWSPKGDKIAFVCRSENRHHIFVSNTDGTKPIQLTSKGSNEDPSWSPDGRYLVFASSALTPWAYNLAIIRLDGANLTQISNSRAGSYDPAWSSWLN